MSQDIQSNSDNQVAVIDENQIKQFKSLYYLIKGKRDTDIKLFTDYKQFAFSDIVELNDKIYRKLELHELVTDIVNVTVGLDNKEIKSFGNWTEFRNADWSISARTKYLTLEWDFNLILPNQTHKVPQTHTLRVRIGNSLKPSEMIHVVFQGGEEYDLEEAQSQMSCKIDFINSQICNELKTVVSEWYDALPKNSEDHKLIKFILRHEVKFQNFIVFSYLTASVILTNYFFSIFFVSEFNFSPTDKDHKLFLFLTVSSLIFFIFYQAGKLFADRMMKKRINKLKRNPMFEITKGDTNRFKEVEKDNKKHIKGLFWTIVIGISVNGITALIGIILKMIIK
jgi:hypothetical protein